MSVVTPKVEKGRGGGREARAASQKMSKKLFRPKPQIEGTTCLFRITDIKNHAMPPVSQEDPLTGPRVYLDLKWGKRKMGRVIISLRADAAPKTSENFRKL
jgi:hypothetical protein